METIAQKVGKIVQISTDVDLGIAACVFNPRYEFQQGYGVGYNVTREPLCVSVRGRVAIKESNLVLEDALAFVCYSLLRRDTDPNILNAIMGSLRNESHERHETAKPDSHTYIQKIVRFLHLDKMRLNNRNKEEEILKQFFACVFDRTQYRKVLVEQRREILPIGTFPIPSDILTSTNISESAGISEQEFNQNKIDGASWEKRGRQYGLADVSLTGFTARLPELLRIEKEYIRNLDTGDLNRRWPSLKRLAELWDVAFERYTYGKKHDQAYNQFSSEQYRPSFPKDVPQIRVYSE